jgi:hypothetical protein
MKDVDVMAEGPHQFVEVRLDRMLFDWLQTQLALRPTARRLSDLFDAANPDWMARFEAFVHAASGTSRSNWSLALPSLNLTACMRPSPAQRCLRTSVDPLSTAGQDLSRAAISVGARAPGVSFGDRKLLLWIG